MFYHYAVSEYPYAPASHALPHTVPREVVGPAPVHNQVFVPLTAQTKPLAESCCWKTLQ